MSKIAIENINCVNCIHSENGRVCNEGEKGVVAPWEIIEDDNGILNLVVHNQTGESVQVSVRPNAVHLACLVHEDGTVVRYRIP